jgi:hypothetical protein
MTVIEAGTHLVSDAPSDRGFPRFSTGGDTWVTGSNGMVVETRSGWFDIEPTTGYHNLVVDQDAAVSVSQGEVTIGAVHISAGPIPGHPVLYRSDGFRRPNAVVGLWFDKWLLFSIVALLVAGVVLAVTSPWKLTGAAALVLTWYYAWMWYMRGTSYMNDHARPAFVKFLAGTKSKDPEVRQDAEARMAALSNLYWRSFECRDDPERYTAQFDALSGES